MPNPPRKSEQVLISITRRQRRALERKSQRTGQDALVREVHKAIDQYLAGPSQIEAAFLKLLEEKAPKDLPAMLARLKRTNKQLDRSLARMKARERRRIPLEGIDPTEVAQLALQTFGSAKKANDWFNRQNRALGQRTPLSLLTSQTGVKRVKTVLGRIAHGVYS